MALTTNGKNYIATNFGVSNCWTATGLTWTAVAVDDATAEESGGTASIVGRLVTTSVYKEIRIKTPIVGTFTYAQLMAANDNTALTLADAQFIAANDGDPATEPKYCVSTVTPTPTPTPPITPTPTPGVPELGGVFEFIGPPVGAPTINLDLSALEMRQSTTDYHFEMNDMVVTSTSPVVFYLAIEVKLFSGALTYCPATGEIFNGLDRISTTKLPRIKVMDPGEVLTVNADFYQPGTILGAHTVCLIVHGAWQKADLEAEIARITG